MTPAERKDFIAEEQRMQVELLSYSDDIDWRKLGVASRREAAEALTAMTRYLIALAEYRQVAGKPKRK